jgi:hypothetical protein
MMRNIYGFTPAQMNAIKDGLFDTLADRLNWQLSVPKRKAMLAHWQQADSYDALIQRLAKQIAPPADNTPPKATALLNPTNLTQQDIDLLAEQLGVPVHDILSKTPTCMTLTTSQSPVKYTVAGIDASRFSPAFMSNLHDALEGATLHLLPGDTAQLIIANTVEADEFSYCFGPDDNDNHNCLSEMQCPCCAQNEVLLIDTLGVANDDVDPMLSQSGIMRGVSEGDIPVTTFPATVRDDGTVDVAGDSEFITDGKTQCPLCDYEGDTREFYATHPNEWHDTF